MDSITQILLGCVIGQLLFGKKYGKYSIILGGISGLIPDLDVFGNFFLNNVDGLLFHRTFTHSFFFAIFGSLFFVFITKKIKWYKTWKYYDLYLIFFFGFLTHFILDSLTTYGTEIFYPYKLRVAFNSIFIIDFFYTFFLLIFLILSIREKNLDKQQKKILYGFLLSSFYLLISLFTTSYTSNIVEKNFIEKNIAVQDFTIIPTFSNIVYHRVLAYDENYYYETFFNIFQKNKSLEFVKYKKNNLIRGELKNSSVFKKLKYFSSSYFKVEKIDGKYFFYNVLLGFNFEESPFRTQILEDDIYGRWRINKD